MQNSVIGTVGKEKKKWKRHNPHPWRIYSIVDKTCMTQIILIYCDSITIESFNERLGDN